MPRFHLHLTGLRWTAHDEEGAEFVSIEHAYLEAFNSGREIWRELLLQREDPRACAFEITDGAGMPVMTVPLTEVLDACRGPRAEPLPEPAAPPASREPPRGVRTRHTAAYVATSAAAVSHVMRMRRLAQELAEQLHKTRASIESARALIAESDRVRSMAAHPLL
jgi:hypothetical protein